MSTLDNMGVTYKLTEEVVNFIVSQRKINPLASCRQLAESASRRFGLDLSKSSVHDVLKENGITTPRGRKPKDKFEIPKEKKKQIQSSLSQIKLLPDPLKDLPPADGPAAQAFGSGKNPIEQAGKIFLQAAWWDLGIYSQEHISPADWEYYLTYAKGVKIFLEDNKTCFIDLSVPVERCIREVADGLVNNTIPFVLSQVSDQELFTRTMQATPGHKIAKISIVDYMDHEIAVFTDIVEHNRHFELRKRIFVETNEINGLERAKALFFTQSFDNKNFIEKILNLNGLEEIIKNERTIYLTDKENYSLLFQAGERFNQMFLRDEENRLVRLKISPPQG